MLACDTPEDREVLIKRFGELLDDAGHEVMEDILIGLIAIHNAGLQSGHSEAAMERMD